MNDRWPNANLVLAHHMAEQSLSYEATMFLARRALDIRLSTWLPQHFPLTGVEGTPLRYRVFVADIGDRAHRFVYGLADYRSHQYPLAAADLSQGLRFDSLERMASELCLQERRIRWTGYLTREEGYLRYKAAQEVCHGQS